MILAIDIGNTVTGIGAFDPKGKLLFHAELSTDRTKTADRCCLDLMDVFRLYRAELTSVRGAILSSVVPPVTGRMAEAAAKLTGARPLIVGPGIRTGLNIRSDGHGQLGSDIVVSSVAALSKYPTPCIMIHFGTAVTYSYLSDSAYEGCAIAPGIGTALAALSERAAQLPHISLEGKAAALGRNTVDAMRAGIFYGYSGAIDRTIEGMEEAAGAAVKTIVATGDCPDELLRSCRRDIVLDRELLMDGLFLLYQKNANK